MAATEVRTRQGRTFEGLLRFMFINVSRQKSAISRFSKI
jgi:hypothetical protein